MAYFWIAHTYSAYVVTGQGFIWTVRHSSDHPTVGGTVIIERLAGILSKISSDVYVFIG